MFRFLLGKTGADWDDGNRWQAVNPELGADDLKSPVTGVRFTRKYRPPQ
ncbi:hypothetical protein [Amycolatopsis sp. cmx-4-54]